MGNISERRKSLKLSFIFSRSTCSAGKLIILAKYPPLVMETNKLHDYQKEATYWVDWLNQKAALDPVAVKLKDFYGKR